MIPGFKLARKGECCLMPAVLKEKWASSILGLCLFVVFPRNMPLRQHLHVANQEGRAKEAGGGQATFGWLPLLLRSRSGSLYMCDLPLAVGRHRGLMCSGVLHL